MKWTNSQKVELPQIDLLRGIMQKIIHQLGKHKIKGEGFNGRREGTCL